MRIGKKIFPYPIINNQKNLSLYEKSTYELYSEIEQTKDKCILKDVHYKMDNSEIEELISKNKVGVYCVVECSASIFRSLYKISETPRNIEIDINDLRDTVQVSSFGVALTDIPNFQNNDFLADFKGYSFDIDKNDILFVDDGYQFIVDYDETKDNEVSSIFTIVKVEKDEETIEVISKKRKINIYLPRLQYERYQSLKHVSYFQSIFFSILLIPALSSELTKIKYKYNLDDEIEDIEEEYSWFKTIEKQYTNIFDKKLTMEEFKELDMLLFSQKLINMPMTKAIDEIFNLNDQGEDEDD